jgi:TonB family protein
MTSFRQSMLRGLRRKGVYWSMQTALYPRLLLKAPGWPSAPCARRPLGRVTSRPGDWHYAGLVRRRISWLAVLVSAGVHALILWGGGPRPVPRPAATVQTERLIQMAMPPLEDEKEDPVTELEDTEQMPAVEVPRLMDLPSTVSLNSFVQPLEMNAALQTNLDTAKLTAIPVRIAPAGQRPGGGLKNLFDISQLDRVPEPVVQPPPVFPPNLKKAVDRAEVMVEFIVDVRGDTRDIHAISSTHSGFDQAAVDGVAKWRFRPGMKDGRKVNTHIRIPIRFLITED